MNIIDLRKKLLQSSTDRRVYVDRRKVPFPPGSPEWIEFIKNNKPEGFEEDRRKVNRRQTDTEETKVTIDSEKPYRRIFLTPGEKKLLQDIYLTDFDDTGEADSE